FFMIAITGRIIPSTAMITGSVKPENRGAFMSINSSIQNMGSGIAAIISGLIVYKSSTGQLVNYQIVGYIAIFATLVCVYLATKLKYE
ncbi:MAG: MFS transporter, partial [Candidatus Sericytochromatia bacterium]|nr:MFS transporter [Candidatus Sericytochromatia bacterium]